MKLSEELAWRGFVNQTTFDDPAELDKKKHTFYWGVDPSASSMTIGNLAAAMMARVFIKHGYKPILLVGGATGLIGDPDGKAQERDLKTTEEISSNKVAIVTEYKKIFEGLDFEVVDNYDWFKGLGYLEFLRDVGKHVPLRQMVNREFVKARVQEGGAGISYAEFSYSLIQGYDFLHLSENHGVTLQLAGADQWGNSIAGVDLIRRKTGREAHVWTAPLIVNKSTGVKFGKSEDGAVWLNPELTSAYKFFQFWLNLDDEGVEDYLKIYTTLEKDAIDSIMAEFADDKSARVAQKRLAFEVTKIVHGEKTAQEVKKVTDVLFGAEELSKLNQDEVNLLTSELPVVSKPANIVQAMVDSGIVSSNSEARRLIDSGAVRLNGQKVDQQTEVPGALSLLQKGKNSFAIIKN